ncbi:MAG: DUF167 domain-containing protein [Planctomycetota bacterium]|jgi:uncharacterized protein (TIGR00251 family)
MTDLAIRECEGGVVFGAKIVPGSSKTAVCGLHDGMVKVRVSAAPEKGKANKCLVEFLAKKLRVKKNAVSILSGQTSPIKKVQVLGLSRREVLERLDLNS